MNKLCALIVLAFSAWVLADATDNEIFLEQSGDTLTLTIDQVGFGNKFCGTISSGACASDMMITGSNITFNVDQIGNSNQLYGPIVLSNSNIDMVFTGDSNVYDWNIGGNSAASNLDLDLTVTGSSNSWNVDIGANQSATFLNYDLTLTGDSNVFTTVVDSSNVKWDWTITGGNNDINTLQKDAAQLLTAELDGSDANIDIVQQSGTCPQGTSSCSGIINLDITSDDATVTINQKDSGD